MDANTTRLRLAIRGFRNGAKVFEDSVEATLDQLAPLAQKHAEALIGPAPFMVEIEFLDEQNQNERFFRIGTDPRRMVAPIAVALDDDGEKVN